MYFANSKHQKYNLYQIAMRLNLQNIICRLEFCLHDQEPSSVRPTMKKRLCGCKGRRVDLRAKGWCSVSADEAVDKREVPALV